MSKTKRLDYKYLWDDLISAICRELVHLEEQPNATMEDIWVKGTLWNVLRKMCALHKLPRRVQNQELTRPLFEEPTGATHLRSQNE